MQSTCLASIWVRRTGCLPIKSRIRKVVPEIERWVAARPNFTLVPDWSTTSMVSNDPHSRDVISRMQISATLESVFVWRLCLSTSPDSRLLLLSASWEQYRLPNSDIRAKGTPHPSSSMTTSRFVVRVTVTCSNPHVKSSTGVSVVEVWVNYQEGTETQIMHVI